MELAIDNVGEALDLNKLSPLECGFLGDEYPTLELVSCYPNANFSQWHVQVEDSTMEYYIFYVDIVVHGLLDLSSLRPPVCHHEI